MSIDLSCENIELNIIMAVLFKERRCSWGRCNKCPHIIMSGCNNCHSCWLFSGEADCWAELFTPRADWRPNQLLMWPRKRFGSPLCRTITVLEPLAKWKCQEIWQCVSSFNKIRYYTSPASDSSVLFLWKLYSYSPGLDAPLACSGWFSYWM
jgi:hypothetical protein